MKKTIKIAAALASVAAIAANGSPAFAANVENPLYLPGAGNVYSKIGAGLMYKVTDSTDAMKAKNHDGATEFPIWRGAADLGVGITDWLAVRGQFGYTHTGDIDRQGMHVGRLGLIGRVFDGKATDGIVWDVYADAHLGGISKMTGTFNLAKKTFDYDNYSNGRWGFYAGTQVGKTWDKFTGAVFGEVLQTFGNNNNKIALNKPVKADQVSAIMTATSNCTANLATFGFADSAACLAAVGAVQLTDSIAVNLKSTLEWNLGLKGFYQIDSNWSVGGAFTYKHHADNGVKSVETKQTPGTATTIANALAAGMKNMEDGFDEYIIGLSVANRLTENVQVALYGEYTMDTSHRNSQNASDFKAEVGARVNVQF